MTAGTENISSAIVDKTGNLEDIGVKIGKYITFVITTMIILIYWGHFACNISEISACKLSKFFWTRMMLSRGYLCMYMFPKSPITLTLVTTYPPRYKRHRRKILYTPKLIVDYLSRGLVQTLTRLIRPQTDKNQTTKRPDRLLTISQTNSRPIVDQTIVSLAHPLDKLPSVWARPTHPINCRVNRIEAHSLDKLLSQ